MEPFELSLMEEGVQSRFERELGPFVMSVLQAKPELIVVSGSVVLDVLNRTSFASDIDIFCVRSEALKACHEAVLAGFVVNQYVRKSYTEGAFDRYQILVSDFKQVDIVVCACPLNSVARFDLNHNKVAFDGQCMWRYRGWNSERVTMLRYPLCIIDDFFAETDKLDKSKLYDSVLRLFGIDFVRTMIRIGKYRARGYEILDTCQTPISLTVDKMELLYLLATQKPKELVQPFNENSYGC